jgi:hypothetical protein
MGKPQNDFCDHFKTAFQTQFGKVIWHGGQLAANMIAPTAAKHLRRDGLVKSSEKIELGDLRTTFRNYDIMVEYESGCASAYNILKHWAYLRGELSAKPQRTTLLCCFCDYWSYGAVRDVCQWTINMMEDDPLTQVKVRMFDHALRSNNVDASKSCINEALHWIASETVEASTP